MHPDDIFPSQCCHGIATTMVHVSGHLVEWGGSLALKERLSQKIVASSLEVYDVTLDICLIALLSDGGGGVGLVTYLDEKAGFSIGSFSCPYLVKPCRLQSSGVE